MESLDTSFERPESDDERPVAVPAAQSGLQRSGTRRGLRWAGVVLAVAALALVPPLLSVNRLQRRIAATMSATLGRPVHLDPSVTMHLLPTPGFTLQNLVVSEDPAFGIEPIIRANTVEASVRLSSLWRRQVEISKLKFVEPSLNVVRNPEGRWNLESLLMHAAQVNTAPTTAPRAGPAPRFPYIEATGGRVNLKLGSEKMPFSLTEADFALWLPTSQQWHLRLEAKPARTNRTISDPGILRVDGTLDRAATLNDVPVNLRGSWYNAPMGEATRIVTGDDAGWRGRLNTDVTLTGVLGAAKLTVAAHVNDLRRADFVPATMLDVTVDCAGMLQFSTATVSEPQCSVAPSPQGQTNVAVAYRLNLDGMKPTGLRLGLANAPVSWLLQWARLFSQRVPAGDPAGQVSGSVVLGGPEDTAAAGWQGEFHGAIEGKLPQDSPDTPAGVHPFAIAVTPGGAALAPVTLTRLDQPPLVLSSTATTKGLNVHLAGTASRERVQQLAALMPPVADGLEDVLPPEGANASAASKLDITCTREWGGMQACVNAPRPEPTAKVRRGAGAKRQHHH